MTIAKRILQNQLRIEQEQRAPFTKKPLIEPQLSKKAKEQMRGNNPFYKLENYDMLTELQLTQILNKLGITMPAGVTPSSVDGRAHITNQLRVLNITTVSDLIRLQEDSDKKLENAIQIITGYNPEDTDPDKPNLISLLKDIKENTSNRRRGVKNLGDMLDDADEEEKPKKVKPKQEVPKQGKAEQEIPVQLFDANGNPIKVEMGGTIPFIIVESGKGRTTNDEIVSLLKEKGVKVPSNANKEVLLSLARENGATIKQGKKVNKKGNNKKGVNNTPQTKTNNKRGTNTI